MASFERTRATKARSCRRAMGDDPLRAGQQCAHVPALLDPFRGVGGPVPGCGGGGADSPNAVMRFK
jgi:hypothetical protein